jgi:DnaJ-class molecular chaperone
LILIMNQNPYSILNISEDATYEEIKDSYLHLSRNLHPDKQPL